MLGNEVVIQASFKCHLRRQSSRGKCQTSTQQPFCAISMKGPLRRQNFARYVPDMAGHFGINAVMQTLFGNVTKYTIDLLLRLQHSRVSRGSKQTRGNENTGWLSSIDLLAYLQDTPRYSIPGRTLMQRGSGAGMID